MRPKHRFQPVHALLTTLLCLVCGTVVAQTLPDAKQPVHISADRFHFNQQTGTGDYSGHVVVTQGKLVIRGDKLDILAPGGGPVQSLTMIGAPANFEDVTRDGKHVSGHARNMRYDPAKDRIVLTGDAQLQQSGNTFRSDHIAYDLKRSVVDAGAPGQRIEATFTPKSQPANKPGP